MKLSESEARKIINLNPRGAIDKDIAERQFQVALKGFNALIQPDTDFLYIADEVGLGKTYIALAIASLLRHFCPPEHRDIYQDVIFVPKRNLQYKWLKEIKNFIGSNFLINGNIVKSALDIPVARCSEESVHHYLELYQDSSSYEIFRNSSFSIASSSHYDWKSKLKERLPLDKQLIFAKGIKIYRKAEDEVLLRRLFAFIMNTAWPEIDLLIVDEAHNYKHGINGSSYRNQVVSRLLGVVQDEDRARLFVDFPELKDQVQKKLIKAIFLSATPIDNGLYEIKQQMDCFFPRHQFSDSINVDEDVGKHIRSFMIRGVMNISVGNEQNVSRNMYRYEHRRGNVEKVANAKPQYLEDELESLIIGLIQYETIQYFGSTKRKSFEIGMLAGFETFSLDDVEEDKEYEESSDRKNNRSVDHNVIQVIAKSYFDEFGTFLPHPKQDNLVKTLMTAVRQGSKSLVFVRRIASVKELEKKLNQEIELWQYEKIKKYLKKGKRLIGLKQAYDDRNAALEIEYVLMELSKKLVYQFKYELAQLLNLDENNDLQAPLINEYLDVLYHSDDDTVGHDNFRNMVKNHIGKKSYKSEFKESTLSLLKVELAELIRKQQEEGEPEFPDEKDDSNPNNFFSIFFGSKRYIEGFNFRKRVSTKNWYSYNYFHLKIHITEIDFSSSNVEQIHFGARDRTDARKIDYVNEKLLEALKKSKGINGQKIDERFQVKTFFNYLFDQLLYEEFHEWITSKWKVKVTTHDFLNDLEALFKIMEGIFRNGSGVLPAFIAESISNDNFENNLIEILNESFPIVIQELKFILRDFDKIMATNFSDKTKIQKALYGQTPVIGVSGFHSRDVSRVATQFRMPGYPYVLITTDILKEGEDLHLYCKDVYHYGIAWNPSDMEQRTGRIDRINSDCYFGLKKSKEINFENSLQVFYPYLADTLEVNQVSKVFYKMNEFIKTFYDITTKTNHDPYASIDELVQEIPSQVRDRLESKFDFHSFTGVKDYPKTELTVIKGVGSQRSELEQVLQIVLVELKDTYKDFFINPTLNNHHLFITANINLNGRRAPLKISFVKGRHFDQIDLSIESIICKGTELRRLDQRNEIREILANKELELRNYNDLLLARKTLILNTESKDRINWITTVLKVADKIEEDYTAGGDSEEEL